MPVSKEDLAKQEILRARRQNLLIEDTAKMEVSLKKEQQIAELNDYIFQIHGKWVNETDFTDYSFKQVINAGPTEVQQILLEEIDKSDESRIKYKEFVNLYIDLYYRPLVEEYEEAKYFTRNSDKKLYEIGRKNTLSSIKFK